MNADARPGPDATTNAAAAVNADADAGGERRSIGRQLAAERAERRRLERRLAAEREKRQAIIDRYERLLADRTAAVEGAGDAAGGKGPDGGLSARLRRAISRRLR